MKKLKSLGKKVKYPTKPDQGILEMFENKHKNRLYLVPFVQDRDEFTSLCPQTGQPDHARMEIVYIPNNRMLESKSLKLYLFSFMYSGQFHEDVCNRIANDLFEMLEPMYLRVYGNFAPRGGIAIKPIVELFEFDSQIQEDDSRRLVEMWDRKKKTKLSLYGRFINWFRDR